MREEVEQSLDEINMLFISQPRFCLPVRARQSVATHVSLLQQYYCTAAVVVSIFFLCPLSLSYAEAIKGKRAGFLTGENNGENRRERV